MKKSFFKKLSFVLALAMIVSTIAPAASAFAAATPKISTTATKYLTLGQTNEYNFNVANKATGAKYAFTSSDKKVATVDSKSGVTTAKAVGTTTIKLTATLKNGKKYTSSCKVIVKDNFKTLVIAGAPVDGKLVVGKENTFSTTGTTYGGASASKTAVVAFTVTDADSKATTGAAITDAGVFKATVPGTYKVTANAFQSSAKYTDWKTTGKGATATVSTTVTVVNAIKSVTAVKTDTLKVTFEAAATAVDKANFTLANKATSAKVVIKSVDLDTTKTFATVTTYDTLVSGQTYTLTAKVDGTDMSGEVAFVKGTPKSIVAPTAQTAPAGQDYNVKYTVYDENGLDITNGTSVYFDESYAGVNGKYNIPDKAIVYVTVYYINPTTGEQLKSDKITITASTAVAADLTSYTITSGTTILNAENAAPDFNKPTTSIKKDVPGFYAVKIKAKDQYGNNNLTPANDGSVTYEALDPSVFVIDTKSGIVTPVSAGTGSFRITYGGVSVIKTLEIKAKPVRATLVPDKASITVSSTGKDGSDNPDYTINSGTLKYKIKDQYGDDYFESSAVTAKVISDNTTAFATITVAGSPVDLVKNASFSLNAGDSYTIKAKDANTTGTVVLQLTGYNFNQLITINVIKADNAKVGYTISGIKPLDIEQKYDAAALNTSDYETDLAIYSVNAAGYKVQKVTDGLIEIKAPDATTVSDSELHFSTVANTTGVHIAATDSLAFKTGVFTITAKRNGYKLLENTITVSDTGVKPAITLKKNAFTGTSLTTTDITNELIDGLAGSGYSVTSFKYTTGNAAIVNATDTFVTSAAISSYMVGTTTISSTTLYQFTVKFTEGTTGRVWDYNFGPVTVKQS